MAAPIDLRNDFDSVSLRRLAKRTRDATQSRRLLALAEVYDGGSRTDASRIGGVGLQIIRDWVLRFNSRGPDGLVDGKSPGAPSKLNADHRRALAEVVEAGPVPAVDGVVRWRRKDLARWLLETFAISLDETTVGRELKALGFAKISARPRHYAQNELAVEAFKKNFPAELAKIRARLPKGVEIELWWQDEARIGQKNKLTRRWARRGTRPRAPRDQRTEWAYIFGAICPAKGKSAGLVMPWCDTDAMAAHLIEISAAVDPGAHAVLIVDQAGWHLTPKLAIPDNITVLALPPRSPELNPVENVWQFMRDNWLSNRIFKSYEDIVALCCQAWNNLIDQPWKIICAVENDTAHIGVAKIRIAEVRIGQNGKLDVDFGQARADAIGVGQIDSAETPAREIGGGDAAALHRRPDQDRAAQIGAREVRPCQIRPPHADAPELHAGEGFSRQIGGVQIGALPRALAGFYIELVCLESPRQLVRIDRMHRSVIGKIDGPCERRAR